MEHVTPQDAPKSPDKNSSLTSRRATERHKVADTFVHCARRRMLFWKKIATPFRVADIGLGGLSFAAARPPAELGERLRLSIHIPGMLTFSGTARIRRIARAREGGVTVGVVFEDIDTTAYAALKRICERGGKPPAASSKGAAPAVCPSAHTDAHLAGQVAL
jgi:hypothetical protein